MVGDAARERSIDIRWSVGAILALWVLSTDVSWSFAPARLRLEPPEQAASGDVLLPLARARQIAGRLLVATYRVSNRGPTSVVVEARIGSEVLQRTIVAGSSSVTARLVWARPEPIPAAYALRLSGPPGSWSLGSAELSNRLGYSRGLLNLDVLPAGQSYPPVPFWGVMLVAVLFAGLSLVGPARATFGRRRPAEWTAAAAVLLLGAVAVAPALAPFVLVLSPRTFALCVVLLSAPRLASVFASVLGTFVPRDSADSRRGHLICAAACGSLAAAFMASAMLQLLAGFGGNYSGFLHLSRDVAARAPFLRERPDLVKSLIQYDAGYDGQFMYLMAFDPSMTRLPTPELYRSVVDTPPYRYGRVGFSALTRVLSANRPERFPATMMWLIVVAHFAIATGLASTALRQGLTPAASLLYLAIPSFMASMVFALPEALVTAALVIAFVSIQDRRLLLAAISFAVALLIRETSALMVMALTVRMAPREGWRRAVPILVAAFVPVVAWRAYVGWRLMPDFGAAAFVASPGDFTVPLAGLSRLLDASVSGLQPSPEVAAARVFPFIVIAGFALSLWLLRQRRGPLEAVTAAYGLVAVSLSYQQIWSHVPSGERGTFELFLGLLFMLLVASREARRLRAPLIWFFGVLAVYTFTVSPEAWVSREALLLIR